MFAPPADAFALATAISGASDSCSSVDLGLCTVETGEAAALTLDIYWDGSSGLQQHYVLGNTSAWAKWTCPADGPYAFDLTSSPDQFLDTTLQIFPSGADNSFAALQSRKVIESDDADADTYLSYAIFDAAAGTDYYVRIGAWSVPATGSYATLRWSALGTTFDNYAYDRPVVLDEDTVMTTQLSPAFDTKSSPLDPNPYVRNAQLGSGYEHMSWFEWTAPAAGVWGLIGDDATDVTILAVAPTPSSMAEAAAIQNYLGIRFYEEGDKVRVGLATSTAGSTSPTPGVVSFSWQLSPGRLGADGGPGYESNRRQRSGVAVLTVEPAILPPPAGKTRLMLQTITNDYPTPVIVSGQPKNPDGVSPWEPTDIDGTHGDWGHLRVIVSGHDRTWFRGEETIIADYSDGDPGGDDTATVIFPAITSWDELGTGDLTWLHDNAGIKIQKINPNGTVAYTAFVGEIGVEEDALTDSGPLSSVGTFHCRGLWNILDDWITLPRSKPDPIESAAWIEDLVRHARHFGFPGHMTRSGITGIKTGERGEYGAPLRSTTIISTLKLMQRDDGTVYTIKQDGRRLYIAERDWGGSPDFRLKMGQRGVTHNLTRDPTQAFTAIFGRGQSGNQSWENWQYPVAYINPPPYPLDIEAGVFFHAGDGHTGFQPFSDELRAHFDTSLVSQNTYSTSDVQLIIDFQEHVGIQPDGVVGPQTWNAAFQIGQNAHVLQDAYIRELWSLQAVQPDLVNARGGILGPNPGWNPQAYRRREKMVDYSVLDKHTARQSARQEGQRIKLPYYVGTITAVNIDPIEMPALDTTAGMNMVFEGHRGADRAFHIAHCDRQPGMQPGTQRTVSWTVSEKPDDLMTLAQIISRRQGVRDVLNSIRPQRRSSHKTPDWVPFDYESSAGIFHRSAQTAGLWNAYQIPMGEAVDVVAMKIVASVPCKMAAAMFNHKTAPAQLTALPGLADPGSGAAGDDPWMANADALDAMGIQWSTGGPGAMQGYWPHAPSETATLTGVLADTAPWPYRTLRPPWGWLLVWTSTNCHVSGDPENQYRTVFPAPEH